MGSLRYRAETCLCYRRSCLPLQSASAISWLSSPAIEVVTSSYPARVTTSRTEHRKTFNLMGQQLGLGQRTSYTFELAEVSVWHFRVLGEILSSYTKTVPVF